MEKIIVLGASRGLGECVAKEMASRTTELFLCARKEDRLLKLSESLKPKQVFYKKIDISKPDDQLVLFNWVKEIKPDRIINIVGGGPFGGYHEKNWKDHLWAFEVNFLFSAKLLHFIFSEKLENLKQVVLTGSSVAESKPDPMAASYSASKHALKGLVSSLKAEHPTFDIRLYSPPYMDTEMLPPNAWPRQQENLKVYDPKEVAGHMVSWIFSEPSDKFHFTY